MSTCGASCADRIGRNPKLTGRKSASKTGSSTIFSAACTIRSRTGGNRKRPLLVSDRLADEYPAGRERTRHELYHWTAPRLRTRRRTERRDTPELTTGPDFDLGRRHSSRSDRVGRPGIEPGTLRIKSTLIRFAGHSTCADTAVFSSGLALALVASAGTRRACRAHWPVSHYSHRT
jgi:hypothetical protein